MSQTGELNRVKVKRVYRGFTQSELDVQYDARGAANDGQRFRDFIKKESERAVRELDCLLDISYGASEDEVVDIFPADKTGSPIVFFIHGGYWRSSCQRDVDLYALTFIPAGCTYISVNYSLAPAASIDDIVRQCRAALSWSFENAETFNGDPNKIYIIGRSAGAHLAGMMLTTDWELMYDCPKDIIKGATLVSGLFDLEPVRLSSVNNWACLSKEAAYRNSPVHHLPSAGCPLIVAWGGEETHEFKRQSDIIALQWLARGWPCEKIELVNKHHFASMEDLMDRESPLTRAVLQQLGLL